MFFPVTAQNTVHTKAKGLFPSVGTFLSLSWLLALVSWRRDGGISVSGSFSKRRDQLKHPPVFPIFRNSLSPFSWPREVPESAAA